MLLFFSLAYLNSRGTLSGLVLLGIQLPSEEDRVLFEGIVSGLDWGLSCETDNVAVKLFL